MAAVKNIHAQFLRQRISPMRTFAGDEGVHAFAAGEFQVTARAAGDDADFFANVLAARQDDGCVTDGALQSLRSSSSGKFLRAP